MMNTEQIRPTSWLTRTSMSKLVLEIHNPQEDSAEKFTKALGILSKALGVDVHLENESVSEPTPYTSLRELSEEICLLVEGELQNLLDLIKRDWLKLSLEKAISDSFRLNGKIYINPKTGKPLTATEWKAIKRDLTKFFSSIYGQTEEAAVKQAVALGKVLQSMDPAARIAAKKVSLDLFTAVASMGARHSAIANFAAVHTGELIQDMTDRSRKAVVEVIMQGYQDNLTSGQLEERLFDRFSQLNRDFRRIAETETATNFNNGYIAAEIQETPDQPTFMVGISGAGACSWCRDNVDGTVVVALDKPPDGGGDTVTVDGVEYTAIWPGKSNIGRTRAEWRVCPIIHPHCRCSWTRYDPRFKEYEDKLRAAMEIE